MCLCEPCSKVDYSECETIKRLKVHGKDTSHCILISPLLVTLVVGPQKQKISCHRVLLACYSEFFGAAFYGQFQESHQDFIEMPEDDPFIVRTFVSWCYTGQLILSPTDDRSENSYQRLWAFGDQVDAPRFMNEAMYELFNFYSNGHDLTACQAKTAYNTSTPDSKLRKFTKDMIHAQGPFHAKSFQYVDAKVRKSQLKSWTILLKKGGDLVVDQIGGFKRYAGSKKKMPWALPSQEKYLENVSPNKETVTWLVNMELYLENDPSERDLAPRMCRRQ